MIEKDNLEKKILDLLLFVQVDSIEDVMGIIQEMNDNINNLEIINKDHLQNIAALTNQFENLKSDCSKRVSGLKKEIDKQQQLFNEMTESNQSLTDKLNEANQIIEQNTHSKS